jgi:hypothetical protein
MPEFVLKSFETILPEADNTFDIGSASLRWGTDYAQKFRVFAFAGDANPTTSLETGALYFGAGGGSAVDTTISRTGANSLGLPGTISTASTWTAAQTFYSSDLLLNNPANTFHYTFVGAALAASYNITLPLLTASDTMAVLGFIQTFSQQQTFGAGIVLSNSQAIAFGTGGSITFTDATATIGTNTHYVATAYFNNITFEGATAQLAGTYEIAGTPTVYSSLAFNGTSLNIGAAGSYPASVFLNALTFEGASAQINGTYEIAGTPTVYSSIAFNGTSLNIGSASAYPAIVYTNKVQAEGASPTLTGFGLDTSTAGTGILNTSQEWTAAQIFESGDLQVEGAGVEFVYSFVGAALAASHNITLPLLTGNDTMAVLGFAQSWTAVQSFGNTYLSLGGAAFDITKVSVLATGDIIIYDGTNWINLAVGTGTQLLGVSAGKPAWVAAPASGVTSIGGATGAITLSSGLSMVGQALTVTFPTVVTSLGAQTGAITLSSGLTMVGSVLTVTFPTVVTSIDSLTGAVTTGSPNSTLSVGTSSQERTFDINLSHANTWAAVQKFTSSDFALLSSGGTNYYTFVGAALAASHNLNFPLLTADDTLACIGFAQTWGAVQTFGSNISFLGYQLATSGSVTSGQVLEYNGSNWVNATVGGSYPDLFVFMAYTLPASATYNTVLVANSATLTINGPMTLTAQGTFEIVAGATVSITNATIVCNSFVLIDGTLTSNNAGDSITFNAAGSTTANGTWNITGTITLNSTHTYSSGSLAGPGTIAGSGTLSITAGVSVTILTAITFSISNMTGNGTGIIQWNTTYTITLSSTLNITGSLYWAMNGTTPSLSGAGSFVVAVGQVFYVGGNNFTFGLSNATPLTGSGTVNFTGSTTYITASQTWSIAYVTGGGNLTINAASVTLTIGANLSWNWTTIYAEYAGFVISITSPIILTQISNTCSLTGAAGAFSINGTGTFSITSPAVVNINQAQQTWTIASITGSGGLESYITSSWLTLGGDMNISVHIFDSGPYANTLSLGAHTLTFSGTTNFGGHVNVTGTGGIVISGALNVFDAQSLMTWSFTGGLTHSGSGTLNCGNYGDLVWAAGGNWTFPLISGVGSNNYFAFTTNTVTIPAGNTVVIDCVSGAQGGCSANMIINGQLYMTQGIASTAGGSITKPTSGTITMGANGVFMASASNVGNATGTAALTTMLQNSDDGSATSSAKRPYYVWTSLTVDTAGVYNFGTRDAGNYVFFIWVDFGSGKPTATPSASYKFSSDGPDTGSHTIYATNYYSAGNITAITGNFYV